MIIIKIVNQQLVQVAFAGHQPGRQLLSAALASRNNKKQLGSIFARTLVQSSAQSQKVTNANNQQLIPVARNISFRQCQHSQHDNSGRHRRPTSASSTAQAPYSISAAQYVSTTDPYIVIDDEEHDVGSLQNKQQHRESPFEVLKRHAKDAKERRDLSAKSRYYGQSFEEAMATSGETSERRLVVLLSWLEAKEKHIEKYRQFYLDRGFDVLNVKTSPWDLLLPNVGARKISEDFVRFMVEKQYSNVVVHGFSVGGYMFGRFLLEMDKFESELRGKLLNSIRGIIFDSLVPLEGIAPGVSRSITQNPLGAKVLEKLIEVYLDVAKNIATKHYVEASKKVWAGPLRCPTLFLMSKDDNISDHRIVERLASVWSNLGIECRRMLVDSSPHVQLFTKHHESYVKQVDNFLKHIKAPPKPLIETTNTTNN
uniref:Transmembrane protein 53 n=2 Tax=Aceria tosichella TaxID=561515 RepID=A0A6G1S4J9_9ACAR